MEMTYDWIVFSSAQFKQKIRETILCNENRELIWDDMVLISFNHETQYATVKPLSSTSPFHYKIIPKMISYKAVISIMDKNFDNINDTDIILLDE